MPAIPLNAQYNLNNADACTTKLFGNCPFSEALIIVWSRLNNSSLNCCNAVLDNSPFLFCPVRINNANQLLLKKINSLVH